MTSFSERIRGQKTGVFKVADFAGGREAMLTIDYLEEEVEIFGKVADLLHFAESRQQLALNQKNAEFLLNALGDDTENIKANASSCISPSTSTATTAAIRSASSCRAPPASL